MLEKSLPNQKKLKTLDKHLYESQIRKRTYTDVFFAHSLLWAKVKTGFAMKLNLRWF